MILYSQFLKGTAYFKAKFASGMVTPPVQRQLAQFERDVIAPFDAACRKMTAAERKEMEAEYVPF